MASPHANPKLGWLFLRPPASAPPTRGFVTDWLRPKGSRRGWRGADAPLMVSLSNHEGALFQIFGSGPTTLGLGKVMSAPSLVVRQAHHEGWRGWHRLRFGRLEAGGCVKRVSGERQGYKNYNQRRTATVAKSPTPAPAKKQAQKAAFCVFALAQLEPVSEVVAVI